VSLGRLNYCLRALIEKGWVKAHNFRRSDNKLAYAYVLTPRGLRQRATLTSNFLARKKREYDELGREIAALQSELAAKNAHDQKRGAA
jgi:MarR family transcriptional regulator, temperature-dependent positive regulator of motility